MLSGGQEAVLVLWQMDTKHKDFLPRLGSEIRHISASRDLSLYALALKDNSIRIISSTNLAIKQTVMGLKYATIDHSAPSIGLLLDNRTNSLVLNGIPGTLQFYDAIADRHILEVCRTMSLLYFQCLFYTSNVSHILPM